MTYRAKCIAKRRRPVRPRSVRAIRRFVRKECERRFRAMWKARRLVPAKYITVEEVRGRLAAVIERAVASGGLTMWVTADGVETINARIVK